MASVARDEIDLYPVVGAIVATNASASSRAATVGYVSMDSKAHSLKAIACRDGNAPSDVAEKFYHVLPLGSVVSHHVMSFPGDVRRMSPGRSSTCPPSGRWCRVGGITPRHVFPGWTGGALVSRVVRGCGGGGMSSPGDGGVMS